MAEVVAASDEPAKKARRIVDDDDDATMAEAPAQAESRQNRAQPLPSVQEDFSPELLRMYYDRIFPAQLMCRWLGYGSQHEGDPAQQLLHRREFSFTTGDDVYIRYLSYGDHQAFKKDLVSKLPHKIDIGAIFNAAPRDHKKFKIFEPAQREFIIDIDLTDYDFLDVDVKRLETCDRCWPLMNLALRVLTRALREDFGFDLLLWVYSGRRGIHCWVCDPRARLMSNEVRSAVADYLGPKLNASTGRLQVNIPMHPTFLKAYEDECKPFFLEYIVGSEAEGGFGILDSEAGQTKMLEMFGEEFHESIRDRFLEAWAKMKDSSGRQRWEKLSSFIESEAKKPGKSKLASILVEIIFTYTYPRLDVNVSKGMNHLLKSPWCVHPKTGRVCVPLDPEMAATFDPKDTPCLRSCANDLDAAHKRGEALGNGKDISATQLQKYEAAFDAFLKRSENSVRAEKVRTKQEGLEF